MAAWLIGGSILGSALIGGVASNSAAGTQADAANNATNAQLSMFNTTQNNLAPYMTAGTNALTILQNDLGLLPTSTTTVNPNATPISPWVTSSGYGPTSGSFVPNTSATYSGDPTTAITQMYQNLLGRPPDPSGLAYWVQQANSGVPLSKIAANISGSPEGTTDASKIASWNAANTTTTTTPPTGITAANSPLSLPTYGSTINGIAGPQSYGAAQYQQSPGYQWQLSQGLGAISNAASAQGGIQSGNTLKALQTYGQGLANQDFQQAYNNYAANYGNAYNSAQANANTSFNRLQTLAGSGQNAAANLGSLSSQTAAQVNNNIIGAGNANAAGIVGAGNAATGGLNSLASLLTNPQYAYLFGGSQAGTSGLNLGPINYGSDSPAFNIQY